MEQAIRNLIKYIFDQNEDKGLMKSNANPSPNQDFDLTTINELILDGRKFRSIEQNDANLLKEFTNLTKLSCNRTGLSSLEGFPLMPSVHVLEITDNYLSGGMQYISQNFPNLTRLELGGNRISSIQEIIFLQKLVNLESLGLEMNPIAEMPDYRDSIFKVLTQVKHLDGVDQNGVEIEVFDDDEAEMSEDYSDEDIALKDFYEKDYDAEEEIEDEDFEPGDMVDDVEEDLSDVEDDDEEDDEDINQINNDATN